MATDKTKAKVIENNERNRNYLRQVDDVVVKVRESLNIKSQAISGLDNLLTSDCCTTELRAYLEQLKSSL